jgi:hypothetical protein
VVQAGNWTVTGGQLKGGTNALFSYANVYLTNNWADYAVQAQFQFPPGAYGGGIGGRLNPAIGQHYAAWVYPEGSPGGSSVLKLIKFQNWTTWTLLQQVNLATVGTNWHTLKLAFQANHVAVTLDGIQLINLADPAPYLSGGVSVDMWTDAVGYSWSVDAVNVSPLIADDDYTTAANSSLTVPAPGVLANDLDLLGPNLGATLVASPTHGSLSLAADGSFSYTPAANYSGADTFVYRATDGANILGTAWVNITITPAITNPPVSPVIQSIQLSNSIATLVWSAVPGHTYRLQRKLTLDETNWTDLTPDITATDPTASATDATGSPAQQFYRVLLLP